ncbi:MAG TPA: RAMP superfamily CRISPR-associated protein [Caldisericia bacterium]|nr:RAMP superfamily CRISPR-associated protein [Caldisericia bacterium]
MSYDYFLDKCKQGSANLYNLMKEEMEVIPQETINLLRFYNTFLTKDSAKLHYMNIVNSSIVNSSVSKKELKKELKNYFEENKEKPEHSFHEITKLIEGYGIGSQNDKLLPKYCALIEIKFKLLKPYLSRDDEALYVHDNPVKKEKVFKIPYIPATTWKGNLRSAAMQNLLNNDQLDCNEAYRLRLHINKLFGTENQQIEKHLPEVIHSTEEQKSQLTQERKGRISFFPTFFRNMSIEIINPQDKETGSGTIPILFEAVPEKTKGSLKLIYFPFDLMHPTADHELEQNIQAMISDIKLLREVLLDTLVTYGFGAKKTSGYGTVDESYFKISFHMFQHSSKKYEYFEDYDDCFDEIEDKYTELGCNNHA